MPHIHVTAPQGVLEKQHQDILMSRLSNAVLKAERAPVADPGAQALTWAYFHEQPEGTTYIGDEAIPEPPLRIAITTPHGGLNSATRVELAAEVGTIVDEFAGPFENRLNHWTMLYEVAEGSWAGGGLIFPLTGIQEAMSIKAA